MIIEGFSIKTCCGYSLESPLQKHMLWVLSRIALTEAILMNTHNICFYGELTKIILQLSSNTLLICSSGIVLSTESQLYTVILT